MLLVSWNVAGLKPVIQRIHTDYGTPTTSYLATATSSTRRSNYCDAGKSSESNSSSQKIVSKKCNANDNTGANHIDPFAKYLALHGDVSILCLQEHKIPHGQLSTRSEPHRCSSVPGYESFWSCNISTSSGKSGSAKSRGFNGVVTYAKVGTVRRSSCTPFDDPSLDNQGRCIVTDHGKWILFNVYVPCGFSREKMRFLRALRKAMQMQRDGRNDTGEKKSVVLVGDLNLKHCVEDVYWKNRLVDVDRILEEVASAKATNALCKEYNKEDKNKSFCCDVGSNIPRWKVDLERNWDRISASLQTIEAVSRKTTNPSTGESFDKFRARVKVIAAHGKSDYTSSRYVYLGSYEDTEEEALGCYDFDEQTYYEDTEENTPASTEDNDVEKSAYTTGVDNLNNQQQLNSFLYRKKNLINIETLTELMSKIVNVFWNEDIQREIAKTDGQLNSDAPDYMWMKKLLDEDGMVDVFRHFYPRADSRFTCWHQLRNKRYTNEGSRIDYTLVDQSLLEYVERGEGTLRCGPISHDNPLGEDAALMAATANGMFESGTFAGGGIAPAPKSALDTQFGPTHTGMIYTPPSYSDHIAISLVFNDRLVSWVGDLALDEKDAATRRSQPHKKQRSIASFLAPKELVGRHSPSSSFASSQAVGNKRGLLQNGDTQKKKAMSSYIVEAKKLTNKTSSSTVKAKSSSTRKESVKPNNSILNHFKKA